MAQENIFNNLGEIFFHTSTKTQSPQKEMNLNINLTTQFTHCTQEVKKKKKVQPGSEDKQ